MWEAWKRAAEVILRSLDPEIGVGRGGSKQITAQLVITRHMDEKGQQQSAEALKIRKRWRRAAEMVKILKCEEKAGCAKCKAKDQIIAGIVKDDETVKASSLREKNV